jgi:hypothetical protein
LALLPPVTAEKASLSRYFGSHREEFQTVEEFFCGLLFSGAKSSVYFSEVYRAACQQVALSQKLIEKVGTPKAPVEMVEYNGSVEEKNGHQR